MLAVSAASGRASCEMMRTRLLTRRELMRELGRLAGGALAMPFAGACASAGRAPERLLLAPSAASSPPAAPGLQPLGLGGERDGVLYVPPETAGPVPLLLMLHGAGGTGRRAARLVLTAAEEARCMLLAPDSRGPTWDAVTGDFGPDARFIERALSETLERRAVDPGRIAAAGFSDGATYALGLGRANGGLVTHILAFSPGFLVPAHLTGVPRIFVSHGRADEILPIDLCSRLLVPELRRDGYDVRYREFDGGHEVPPAIAREAVEWFLDRPAGYTRPDPQ